jgi:hypothetical protein
MNKKITLSIFLTAVLTVSMQAQFSVGLRGGFNLTGAFMLDWEGEKRTHEHLSSTDSVRFGFLQGFQVGLVADIGINESFSIQPGILFSTSGTRTEWSEWDRQTWSTNEWNEDRMRITLSTHYIKVPINAQLKLPIGHEASFLVQAGPYVGYAIGGRVVLEGELRGQYEGGGKIEKWNRAGGEFEKIKFGSDNEEHNLKRLDFGVGAGLGVQFGSFQIGVNYNFGLMNIAHQHEYTDWSTGQEQMSKTSFRNHGLSFTVTYLFGGDRRGW